MNRRFGILIAFMLAGCATPRPDAATALIPAKEARIAYIECLKSHAAPYLPTTELPQDIADAVSAACDRDLSTFRMKYREGLQAQMADPTMSDAYVLLMTEPELQSDALREKGRRAVVKYVLDSRHP